MPAAPPLQLSISPSSHAEAGGDSLFDAPFNVTFGNKAAARNANASAAGGSSLLNGLVKDVAVGLVVALGARYLWTQIK